MAITQARMIALINAADEAISRNSVLIAIAKAQQPIINEITSTLRETNPSAEQSDAIQQLLDVVTNIIDQAKERISVDSIVTLELEKQHFAMFKNRNDKNREAVRRHRAKLQHNTNE